MFTSPLRAPRTQAPYSDRAPFGYTRLDALGGLVGGVFVCASSLMVAIEAASNLMQGGEGARERGPPQ